MSTGPILELPLRPSTRLRRARWLLLGLCGCYVLELVAGHHWAVAVLAGSCAVFVALSGHRRAPLRLRLLTDGQCFLLWPAGDSRRVALQAGTLMLGSHVLLTWRDADGRRCMLLGPDNLTRGQLAALRRWLARAAAVSGTALHSVAAQGSESPDPP